MNNKNFKFYMDELYATTDVLIREIQDSNTSDYKRNCLTDTLIKVTEQLVKNNCRRYLIEKKVINLSIDDLYEIATSIALVEAIRDFKQEFELNFLKFWWMVMVRSFNKAFIKQTTHKEKLNSGCYSLDSIKNKSENDFTEDFCNRKSLEQYINEFENVDKYGKLIRCEMLSGQNERKLARLYILGVEQYGSRERKIVQRTKERFKMFLISNGFEN